QGRALLLRRRRGEYLRAAAFLESCLFFAGSLNVRGLNQAGIYMASVLILISTLIEIFIWLLIANAILSWLVAFNVVNTSNQFVNTVGTFLYRVTEPPL